MSRVLTLSTSELGNQLARNRIQQYGSMQLEATERRAFRARFYRIHLVPPLSHSVWV
jgi:hypothetical protein